MHADTNGFGYDDPRVMWHYRDWVWSRLCTQPLLARLTGQMPDLSAFDRVGGNCLTRLSDNVMVPYADFNLLRLPDKARAMAKIKDLTLFSDIIPTGYHGAWLMVHAIKVAKQVP
jgi:hypothetical protein